MTLVEVIIAAAVFGIAFAGILVGHNLSREHAEEALIDFSVLQYAQGLLEVVQSYPYEDEKYPLPDANPPTPQNYFNGLHGGSLAAFDVVNSGVMDSTTGAKIRSLPEDALTLQYFPSRLPAKPDALNPFVRPSRQNPDWLLGPELDDHASGSNPATGVYVITPEQLSWNTFQGDNQAKYYFMDDVDDFDGYQELRFVFNNVPVTFEISVMGVFQNQQDFTASPPPSGLPSMVVTQNRYSIMKDIAVTPLANVLGVNLTASTPSEAQRVTTDYYKLTLFKKVTVKATWEYPLQSGKKHSLVLDGGTMNPKGVA